MWRILAVEDGSFSSKALGKRKDQALLVGVITHSIRVEEVLLSKITVDGLDATERLIELAKRSKNLNTIMLASVAYAGFNLMDPAEISTCLQLPVVIVNPKKPNMLAMESAIRCHFADWRRRLTIIQKAGTPNRLQIDAGRRVYIYTYGLPVEKAKRLVRSLTVFGNRPEPLRIARLLAHGLGSVR